MAANKKRKISRFVKQARSATALYKTAEAALPTMGDTSTKQVGYAGLTPAPNDKQTIRVLPEASKASAETYGLELYTIADLDGPMSLMTDDYEQIPLDYDTEYDDDNRSELRLNLGKLLDSL